MMLHKFAFFLIFPALASCASPKIESEGGLGAIIKWEDRHRCSRISPEILLSGVPAETVRFAVWLEEGTSPRRYLGGGIYENDRQGIIPEGALAQTYRGACPGGETKRYRYTVAAYDKSNKSLANVRYEFDLK